MPEISRRNLIRGAAVVGGAAAAATVSASAAAEGANAAATVQAAGQASGPRHGDIRDIRHVMILMQENRSFDHYFGSLKGVQGFGDKATIMLPGGLPQPHLPVVGVFGLPSLPFITAPVGEAHSYHPVPASDVMPVQEAGSKPARALPYQPNASLTGFTTANGTTTATLALSNSGHFAGRSAHFSVYDNTLPTTPSVASYPDGFPGQYTVAPSAHAVETVAAAGPVSPAGAYDITVIGPNRFLRRFTGNVKTAGATATVEASYFAAGFAPLPLLTLRLTNGGKSAVTFTVRANNYSHAPAQTYHVPAGRFLSHEIDPVRTASGWYDVTVTVSSDSSWSQRFTGHLENGQPSITG